MKEPVVVFKTEDFHVEVTYLVLFFSGSLANFIQIVCVICE